MGLSSGTTRLFTTEEAEKVLGEEITSIKQYFQGRIIHYSEIYKCFFGEAAPRELFSYLALGVGKEAQDKFYFNYDDLIYLLAILKYARNELKGKFLFQMLGTGSVSLPTIQRFGREIGAILEDIMKIKKEFLALNKLEMDLPTFLELFTKYYRDNTLFNWMTNICGPYRKMEDAISNSKLDSRLSSHRAREIFPAEIEMFIVKRKISPERIEGYQKSFSFLESKSLLTSAHILTLFQENKIRDPLISRLGNLLASRGKITFSFFLNILSPFFESSLSEKRNRMLFKLFSEPDKKFIKTEKILEMVQSWMNNSEQSKAFSNKLSRVGKTSKEEFLKLAQREMLTGLDKLHFMPYIDLHFTPDSPDTERKCIESILNNKATLEQYINDCLNERDKFYLISTAFWNAWTSKVGWNGRPKGGEISEELIIEVPSEKGYLRKLDCTLVYPENCVFVPERVYLAFRKWYQRNVGYIPVRRKVIKYPLEKEQIKLVNPNEIKMGKHNTRFLQIVSKDIKELLVNKYYFNAFRIQDNGKFPVIPTYTVWERIIGEQKTNPYFIEIYISPKKTVENLIRKIQKLLVTEKGSNMKMQLYIGNRLVEKSLYSHSLEQYFAHRGEIEQLLYLEIALPNGIWPTDLARESTTWSLKPITNGLTNLGNTCYINAALQCLYNVPFMREYFVTNSSIHFWRKHINLYNFRSNRKGVLVKAFAELGQQLWKAPEPAINPREFRATISQFKEDFKRNDQQDTHEFLGFMLDELHEELNLVINKVAYTYPESGGRKPGELALEYWSLNLLQNWSIIYFCFMGQLGSVLKCKHCGYASWTFEPFNMLSLPIPSLNFQTISVVFVPLSNHFKQQLVKKPLMEQPIQYITVFVKKNSCIEDISQELRKMPELNLEISTKFSRIEFCKIIKHRIYQIYKPTQKIEFLESIGNAKELFAIEILTQEGRQMLSTSKEIIEKEEKAISSNFNSSSLIEEKYLLFNPNRNSQSLAYRTSVKFCPEFFVNVINRIVLENPRHIWKKFDAQIVGNPTLLLVNSKITNYELYEQLHEVTTTYLKKESPYLLRKNLWWNDRSISNKKPFILRYVNYQGTFCGKCSWRTPCLGCIIPPDENIISLNYESTIAVDWSLEDFQKDYQIIREIAHHDSVKQAIQAINTPVELSKMLSNFLTLEDIPDSKCINCHEISPRFKALSIFKLPSVLIIHLKRYKESASAKNNSKIDFPLEDFDMSSYVHADSEEKSDEAFYDLYAIINHYGILNAGHYTTHIRSGESWFCYDDSRVYEISQTDLNPASAYILFYLRKGATSLNELFPPLGKSFRGCPVKTKLGEKGFIKEIRTREDVTKGFAKYVVKSFTSNLLMCIGEDDIEWEDNKQRLEMLSKKMEEYKPIPEKKTQETQPNQEENNCLIV